MGVQQFKPVSDARAQERSERTTERVQHARERRTLGKHCIV
jgi:hypothetical protein